MIESSIIIPVFNQWELTRACLKALASTTKNTAVEVIVVDNASTDATQEACAFLGKKLFGEAFRYFRCASNMNFGPASNIGATMAEGEYLIFLNNDTVPLPGWYQPLIDDFSRYSNIAATGPLLLYPEKAPFGCTVQHLGVIVSPFSQVGHLYAHIPADSPLAQKRRFFQIITAACMVVPRKLFLAVGLFDEDFINGFEDVELCLRLWQRGYRMTVNPEARVIHHTSQTPGREQHHEANCRYLSQKGQGLFVPDWHQHLQDDGLRLTINSWQLYQPVMSPEELHYLDSLAMASREDVKDILVRHPFWKKGWRALIDGSESESERAALLQHFFKLIPHPHIALEGCKAALAEKNIPLASTWFHTLSSFCKPFESYVSFAKKNRDSYIRRQFADMAQQCTEWLNNKHLFKDNNLRPLIEETYQLARQMKISWSPPS